MGESLFIPIWEGLYFHVAHRRPIGHRDVYRVCLDLALNAWATTISTNTRLTLRYSPCAEFIRQVHYLSDNSYDKYIEHDSPLLKNSLYALHPGQCSVQFHSIALCDSAQFNLSHRNCILNSPLKKSNTLLSFQHFTKIHCACFNKREKRNEPCKNS